MLSHPALIAARLALGVLTWTAIGVQLTRHLAAGLPLLTFVSYFTILSNGIAGTILLVGAVLGFTRRTPPSWFEPMRGASALYMAVVGVVFVTLLRNADLGALLPWVNTVHHYVMPVAVVTDWLLIRPAQRLTMRDLLTSFVFPVGYVTLSLARGAMVGWYPYPFFNPAVVGGYGVVAVYVAAMLVTFVVVGIVLWRIGGKARPA